MRTFTLAAVRMMAVIAVTLLPAVVSKCRAGGVAGPRGVAHAAAAVVSRSAPDLLFYGQIGTVVLTIPVPAGMTPASLNVRANPGVCAKRESHRQPRTIGC